MPASAAASTATVYAGPPPAAKKLALHMLGKKFSKAYNPDVDAFFSTRTAVHVGDTVSFMVEGFHTIDIPAKGGSDLPLFLTGPTVTGQKDAAGNPFWFNGHVPTLDVNPKIGAPSGAKTYNGTARIESGLPAGSGKPKPLKVKFTKAGTYKFFCDVHPGMVGYIVVAPKSKPVPSPKQDAAAVTKQVKSDLAAAKRLATTKVAKDTVSLGVSAPGGVELFSMFPATLHVKTGTVVTFSMSKYTRETHTATFGPQSYLTGLANGFNSPTFPPIGTYPSDQTQPIPFKANSHGNGFVNTGALDRDRATPLPVSGRIRFDQAGTYHFICLIHPFMHGTVIVK